MGGNYFVTPGGRAHMETNEYAKLGRRSRLASDGGPAGVPRGKRRDTKAKRRRKKR